METSHKSVKDRVRVKYLVIVNYSVKNEPDKKGTGELWKYHGRLLQDLTTGRGNDPSFCHEKQWSKILSRSNITKFFNHCSDSGKISLMHITGMLAYQPL